MAMEPNEACGCVLCDLPFLLKLCGISCQHINGRISFKIWISCISLKKKKKKYLAFSLVVYTRSALLTYSAWALAAFVLTLSLNL